MTGSEFPWTFFPYSVSNVPVGDYFYTEELIKEHIQFRHIFADHNQIKSEFFKFIAPAIAAFENHMGSRIKEMGRIKANLLMPQDGPKMQQPHVDGMEVVDGKPSCVGKHTLLYYVNDSDGDTILYDKYYLGEKIGLVKKIENVSPKKGRAIIFDSNQLHAATCPTVGPYRMVLNCVLGL